MYEFICDEREFECAPSRRRRVLSFSVGGSAARSCVDSRGRRNVRPLTSITLQSVKVTHIMGAGHAYPARAENHGARPRTAVDAEGNTIPLKPVGVILTEQKENAPENAAVAIEEIKEARRALEMCYYKEGVNHLENCKELSNKYISLIPPRGIRKK